MISESAHPFVYTYRDIILIIDAHTYKQYFSYRYILLIQIHTFHTDVHTLPTMYTQLHVHIEKGLLQMCA